MSNHGTVYLVVDALDEGGSGLSELLELMADNGFAPPSRVKWLITSRNREDIELVLTSTSLAWK